MTHQLTDDPALRHRWYRDEDGDIDVWRYGYSHHNGPECERCGEYFCHHCEPECYQYLCPNQQLSFDEGSEP